MSHVFARNVKGIRVVDNKNEEKLVEEHYCDECGTLLPNNYDNVLQLRVLGGYSMFCDPMDGDPWNKPMLYVTLCHDCGADMFRGSKAMQKIYGTHGFHPFSGETRCCEYSWEFADYDKTQLKPEHEWETPAYQHVT